MAVLVDENTKVICQGFTGSQGTFHSEQAIAYGTQMVGGVTPGKGGTDPLGLPVFDTVAEAREATGATAIRDLRAATLRGRRDHGGDRRRDAADLLHHRGDPGDGHDEGQADALDGSKSRLIGPNCPGVITPDACKIGIMPGHIHRRGSCRHRLALRHADLRGGRPDHGGGAGPVDLHRHRRRPDQGHRVHRLPGAVPGRRRRPSRSS